MRSFIHPIVIAVLLASCATAPSDRTAQANGPRVVRSAEWRALEAWHESMKRTPFPKKGCFEVTHPDTEWREVPCGSAPQDAYLPRRDISGAKSYFGQVASGSIVAAGGIILPDSKVTGETNKGSANTFSLQLNSQRFDSPACAGASNPSVCHGWQQFIFANNSNGGRVFIQYWLIDYLGGSTTCPSGWNTHESSCFRNSVHAVSIAQQPATNLPGMVLFGLATPTSDISGLIRNNGKTISAINSDSVLTLSNSWTAVQFNVLGNGGGTEAVFDPGTSITIVVFAAGPTTLTLNCEKGGFTAETNNLTLGPCTSSGNEITFTESLGQ